MLEARQEEIRAIESAYKIKFTPADEVPDAVKISTGIPSLDYVMGGGWPAGRVVELFGTEETGKTTLLYESFVSACKAALPALFVDGERSFHKKYIYDLGLPPNSLFTYKPTSGEQAFRIMRRSIKTLGIKFIGLDSLAGLIPQHQVANETENPLGLMARMMSNELKLLVKDVDDYGAVCILVNQIRMASKGGMIFVEDTTAGKALRFYASIRIGLKADKVSPECRYTKVLIRKNKMAAPLKETYLRILYGKGIDRDFDLVQLARLKGEAQLDKEGWYHYKDKRYRWKSLSKILKGQEPTAEDDKEEELSEPPAPPKPEGEVEAIMQRDADTTPPEPKAKKGKGKKAKDGET